MELMPVAKYWISFGSPSFGLYTIVYFIQI